MWVSFSLVFSFYFLCSSLLVGRPSRSLSILSLLFSLFSPLLSQSTLTHTHILPSLGSLLSVFSLPQVFSFISDHPLLSFPISLIFMFLFIPHPFLPCLPLSLPLLNHFHPPPPSPFLFTSTLHLHLLFLINFDLSPSLSPSASSFNCLISNFPYLSPQSQLYFLFPLALISS